MSLGTLSESRMIPSATSTTGLDVPIPNKNTPSLLDDPIPPPPPPTTTPTTTPPNSDDGLVGKPSPEPTVLPTPAVLIDPSKKPCGYCMAKKATSLAFQISVVFLVLALSFHLVKKV